MLLEMNFLGMTDNNEDFPSIFYTPLYYVVAQQILAGKSSFLPVIPGKF